MTRIACYGAVAPLGHLGLAEWTKDLSQGMDEFVAALLAGEAAITSLLAQEDAEMRAAASRDDPAGVIILEHPRSQVGHGVAPPDGLWGSKTKALDTLAWYASGESGQPPAIAPGGGAPGA